MGRHFLSFLKGCCIIVIVLSETRGLAYPTPVDFDGSILRWDIKIDDEPVTYEVVASETDGLNFASVIEESADLWSNTPNSYFRYARANGDVPAQVTINLQRAIDGSAVSSGYAVFDKYKDRKPVHCSIFILVDDTLSSNSIAKTVLHEMGHCLGLGHSLIPEAIMSYQLEKNSFALDIDDEAAVSRLYPSDGSKPRMPPGCSTGLPRQSPNYLLLTFLFPVIALVGFRKNV